MRGTCLALLSTLALAACQGEAPPENSDAPSADATPPAIASAAELAGEYRIAGVDGSEIDLPHAITASIDAERIHLVSDCVNLAWSYRFEGDTLSTEQAPTESCARGFNPTELALLGAFDAADTVRRTPANAIEFSGNGHSVTLFSQ